MSLTQAPSGGVPELTRWNEARATASRLLAAFYYGEGSIEATGNESVFILPPKPEVVRAILTVGTAGRWFARVDEMARVVQEWEVEL